MFKCAFYGMQIAESVSEGLRDALIVMFASRSREDADSAVHGFHSGDADEFRAALVRNGLTIMDGAPWLRALDNEHA